MAIRLHPRRCRRDEQVVLRWAILALTLLGTGCGGGHTDRSANSCSADSGLRVRAILDGRSIAPLEFSTAPAITWVDDSTLAVIDSDDQQVVRYRVDGTLVGRFGRKGGGPGEFSRAGLVLGGGDSGDKGLLVADAARINRIDSTFSTSRSVSVPGIVTRLLSWSGDRVVALWHGFGAAGLTPMVGEIDLGTGEVISNFSPYAADSALVAAISVPGFGEFTPKAPNAAGTLEAL